MIDSLQNSTAQGATVQNSAFSDFNKKQNAVTPQPQVKSLPADTVEIKRKKSNNTQKLNKFQIATLVTGGLGVAVSAAFMALMFKNMMPGGKSKELLKKINDAQLPDEVHKKLMLEYKKFKNSFMDTDGVQNYINNVLRLNWGKPIEKTVDITRARQILDEDLIGLDKVKDEVIKFLKVQNYNIKNGIKTEGPVIICLDGPPGVGKTSIAESIAKAMDKPFERISLAGVNNKAFVKGAQRVYKSAEPGQIIKSLQNSGVPNPVVLIDEIDKMGSSVENGDPAFALLDALEPKQCKKFTDENLELPYDLSNVTFVITSNYLERIPSVLKDRLSIIHIPPYNEIEKTNICKFTADKMLKASKLESVVKFADDGVKAIVKGANDQGARKTVDSVKYVINHIKETFETDPSVKNIVVDKKFVENALKNRQELTFD